MRRFKEIEMQRVNEFVFYELALKVHQLTELSENRQYKYSEVWFTWSSARDALDEIYRQRPLNFTTPVARTLYQAITDVIPEKWEEIISKIPKQEDELPLNYWPTVYRIREAAIEFETVLRNECQLMDTYFVTKKGTYSTVDLVERAHHQVPETTRSKLPEEAKQDLDQAGKCMAFDVPTAAAFHLLRGTESVIRQYYEAVVPGEKRASGKMRNWGTYIRLLKNHGADDKVVPLLSHMKDVYRNPVLHPEENYDDERVQVLFGLCVSAIVSIEAALAEFNNQSGTLQFKAATAV